MKGIFYTLTFLITSIVFVGTFSSAIPAFAQESATSNYVPSNVQQVSFLDKISVTMYCWVSGLFGSEDLLCKKPSVVNSQVEDKESTAILPTQPLQIKTATSSGASTLKSKDVGLISGATKPIINNYYVSNVPGPRGETGPQGPAGISGQSPTFPNMPLVFWSGGGASNTTTVINSSSISTTPLVLSSLTEGSVLFIGTGGEVMQNNSALYFDNTNGRFGIGTSSPSSTLDVWGNFNVGTSSVATFFANTASGNVGFGTSTPASKLHVYDGSLLVDSPVSISVVGSLAITNVSGVVVSGRYAYISAGFNSIIADVSSPTNPILVSNSVIPNGGYSVAVKVAGNYAYISDGGNSLQVVDISNPSAPEFIGVGNGGFGWTENLYVQGKYVYEAKANGGLQIIDVSNPRLPTFVGGISEGASIGPEDVFVQGRYAYVSYHNNTKEFRIYDISKPSNIVLLGTYTNAAGVYGSFVVGKYAYIGVGTNGFAVLDISNPLIPTEVGSYNPGGFSLDNNIIVAGKYVYAGDIVNGKFYVLDISVPTAPKLVSALSGVFPGDSSVGNSIYISGKYGYVADKVNGLLKIIDLKGADISTASIGNISSGDVTVSNNLDVGNNAFVRSGLNVGSGGIFSNGPLSVSFASTTASTTEVSAFFQGLVGIGTTTPATKLQVFGDVRVGNTGTNGCIQRYDGAALVGVCTSDQNLKKDISYIDGLLGIVTKLKPATYSWNELAAEKYKYSQDTHITGLIAQDVEEVFPELVSINQDGFKTVDTAPLLYYSLGALSELNTALGNLTASSTTGEYFNRSTIFTRILDAFRYFGIIIENGLLRIQKIFVEEATVQKLCVGNICISESELKRILDMGSISPLVPSQDEIIPVLIEEQSATSTASSTEVIENVESQVQLTTTEIIPEIILEQIIPKNDDIQNQTIPQEVVDSLIIETQITP